VAKQLHGQTSLQRRFGHVEAASAVYGECNVSAERFCAGRREGNLSFRRRADL
jgi:hypothetical protein